MPFDWYAICKMYYDEGFYDANTLKIFVVKGKITSTQYEEITGIPYVT